MPTSSAVSSGDLATAAQYNNLRTDVLSTHTHDATDGSASLGGAVAAGLTQARVRSSGLKILNPAQTFETIIVNSAISANRNLTIPLLTADDTLMVLGLAQTMSAAGTALTVTNNATVGGVLTTPTVTNNSTLTLQTTGANSIQFAPNSTNRWAIDSGGILVANTDNSVDIGASNATRPRRIYVAGFIELGGAGSTNNQFSTASTGAGSTTMYIGNASINVTSDVRLKLNIAPTTRDAMAILRALPVIDHTWNDPSDQAPVNRNTRGPWMGITAQALIKHAPWLVNAEDRTCQTCLAGLTCEHHKSNWQVDYAYGFPLLVKGIQELDARLTALEGKVK